MEKIVTKLQSILSALDNNLSQSYGIYGGQAGISLLYAYFSRLTDSPGEVEKMQDSIQATINSFEKPEQSHTFSNGLAGMCWGINHLIKSDFIDADPDELFENIDPHILSVTEIDFQNNFMDPIHGALGTGLYLLDRLPNSNANAYLGKIVDHLYRNAEKSHDGIYWSSIPIGINLVSQQANRELNFGLAHGIPGIIYFLSRCYINNIRREQTAVLLENCIDWLLNRKNRVKSISLFPSIISESRTMVDSRLGWCYGDLGIASSLWAASKALGKGRWEQEATDIIDHACLRRDLQQNKIKDAGICHGTAGVAHFFNHFYRQTGQIRYKETANYWIDETLKMASHSNGLAGFMAWQHEQGWKKDVGLLEGVTGIGLVLVSHLSNETPSWDRCLMLN